jgi:hypothetical protein
MFGASCLQGFFLILFHVSVAYAIGSADSRSTDSFVEPRDQIKKSTDSFADSRDQINKWASDFVAKKRNSITGFAKLEAPLGGVYHYVDERTIFGKTAKKEECALHLGRRLESGEWVFTFYLENKKNQVGSDGAFLLEGYLVVQGQQIVSNIGAVTSLDLHTTPSTMSLLSLDVYTSGTLGEESLSILLDDEDNIFQVTYRFINSLRIRDGRRVDPVTCHFDHVS